MVAPGEYCTTLAGAATLHGVCCCWAGGSAGVEVEVLDGHVPVGVEDFEAALLLFLVGVLVGEKLLEEGRGVEIVVGDLGVLEDDGGAEIPAAVFGGVIARHLREDFENAAQLDFLFQDGIMILLEQSNEFLGVAPL